MLVCQFLMNDLLLLLRNTYRIYNKSMKRSYTTIRRQEKIVEVVMKIRNGKLLILENSIYLKQNNLRKWRIEIRFTSSTAFFHDSVVNI